MTEFHRSDDERRLVPSSVLLIDTLDCHVNLQHCNSSKVASYISMYVSKTEKYSVLSADEQSSMSAQSRDARCRVVGSQELVAQLLGQSMFSSSRTGINVDLRPVEHRTAVVKSRRQIARELQKRGSSDDALLEARLNAARAKAKRIVQEANAAKDRLKQAKGAAAADGSFGTSDDSSRSEQQRSIYAQTRIHDVVDPAVLGLDNLTRYEQRFLGIRLPLLGRCVSPGESPSRLRHSVQLKDSVAEASRAYGTPLVADYQRHSLARTERGDEGIVTGLQHGLGVSTTEEIAFSRLHGPSADSLRALYDSSTSSCSDGDCEVVAARSRDHCAAVLQAYAPTAGEENVAFYRDSADGVDHMWVVTGTDPEDFAGDEKRPGAYGIDFNPSTIITSSELCAKDFFAWFTPTRAEHTS